MAKAKLAVGADFSEMVRAGETAFKTLQEAQTKALCSGVAKFSSASLKNLNKLAAYQKKLTLTQAALEKKIAVEKARGGKSHADYEAKLIRANGDLKRQIQTELEASREKIQAAMMNSDKSEWMALRKKTAEAIVALRKQIADNKELVSQSKEQAGTAKELTENIREAGKEIEGVTKDSKGLVKNLTVAADSAKQIKDAFDDLNDLTKIGERLEAAGEKFGDALKDGIDVQALSRDLGKGLGKAIGLAGKSLGGGMGVLVGGLGAAVAAFGMIMAAVISVDKKIKEFNKNLVKTHGALNLIRLGGGNLARGMDIVRHATQDLIANLGVTQEEATALFDSLDRGGLTLSRLTGGTKDASVATQRLQQHLREIHAVANASGVGLTEYAENLTNYVDDLGMNVNTVNDSFARLASMASDSGFSTRRFYSMVVQATSGQASLNTRLEDTGALLMRMSKIMGMKKAAELAGGADVGAMSAQDRIKTLLIAGGRGKRVLQREASVQAKNFHQANQGTDRGASTEALLGRALAGAGLSASGIQEAFHGALDHPEALVDSLGRLNATQQRTMLSELRASGDPAAEGMARQLEQLVTVTRGARGGLGQQVGALGGVSAGGGLALRAAQMDRFVNSAGEMSAPERAAAENVSGMSGHDLDSFLAQIRSQQGDFETLARRSRGTSKEDLEVVNRLQKLYGVTAVNGRIADESGRALRDGNDFFQSTADAEAAAGSMATDTAMSLAQETMDATVSVADILENQVVNFLQSISEYIGGPILTILSTILGSIPGLGDAAASAKRQQGLTKLIGNELRDVTSQTSTRRDAMATQRAKIRGGMGADASTEQKAIARTATTELARLQAEQTAADARRTALMDARNTAMASDQTEVQRASVQYQATGPGQSAGADFEGRGPGGRSGSGGGGENRTFATRAEAERFAGGSAGVREVMGEAHHESAQETLQRLMARSAATTPPAAETAPAATVVAAGGGKPLGATPAGTLAATTPAAAAPAPAPVPPPTQHAAEVTAAPAVTATEDAAAAQARRDGGSLKLQKRSAEDLAKLAKGKDFGDGLATSKLPDAIAMADSKMRLLEAIYTANPTASADVVQRLLAGNGNTQDLSGAGLPAQAMLRARALPAVEDFVYQDKGGRTMITPISREDQVVGMKPGGPVANAGGNRAGGAVNITINGGDERRVFDIVKRAIVSAGLTPNRVPGNS